MSDKVTPIGDSPAAKRLKEAVLEVLRYYQGLDEGVGDLEAQAPLELDYDATKHWARGYGAAVNDINAAIRAALGEV